jgi:hypothetical protein
LVPILAPACLAAALGYNLLPLIPAWARAYLLIPFLVFFLAMTLLDREPGWNMALLLGFSISAGLLLNWSGSEAARWSTWLLFLGLVGAAWIGAVSLGTVLAKGLTLLFPLTVLYLLGWLGIILLNLPEWVRGLWILSGLALFTVIAAGTLRRVFKLEVQDTPLPLAIELWVILINLFWLSGWIPLGG